MNDKGVQLVLQVALLVLKKSLFRLVSHKNMLRSDDKWIPPPNTPYIL